MKGLLVLALLTGPAFGQYVYYFSDGFNPWINGSAWQANGTWSGGNGLIRSTSSSGASLISKVAVPDGSASYAVRTLVRLAVAGGTYVHYLRASQDAMTGLQAAGTFYSVEWGNLVLGNGCQMTMTVNQRVNGVFTQRASVIVGCQKSLNNTLESLVTANGMVMVYVNGALVYGAAGDNVILSGAPGVGVIGAPVENGLVLAQLGPLDRTAPAAVERTKIATAAMPNSVELAWQGADDGVSGTGVPQYFVFRDGTFLSVVRGDTYSDQTVQAGQSYMYGLVAVDRHNNFGPGMSFTVTTPAVAGESRRVGVRSNGAYWGSAGEQIDMMSGNLNFSVPLLAAARRDGWKLALGLSYNSQNWRRDGNGAEWNLGRDIGYGHGWMLMAGQMRPHYSDMWTVHHWTFVDATGAEYRLDQLDGGKWRSKEATYVRWDAEAQRLWWPDGSYWNFYCVSGAGEADRGTYYPTVFEDRNGNVTAMEYHGGWASGLPDTSGRIGHIVDVRAPGNWGKAYQFYYSWNQKPHLERITSLVGTGENYLFTYSAEGALNSPFTGAAFGTATMLTGVENETVDLGHTFTYGTNGSGELVKAVLPKGAELEWAYGTADYGNGKSFREVTSRWLRAASGAAQWGYAVQGYGASGASCVQARTVVDPSGPDKAWIFEQNPALTNYGLVTAYEERKLTPSFQVLLRQENTWVLDSRGRPYVGTAHTWLEPWTANERISKVETVRDDLGNVTEQRLYDYGQLTAPARTYKNYYVDAAGGRFPTRSDVVEGSQTLVLGEWKYDGAEGVACAGLNGFYPYSVVDAAGITYHDLAYGTGYLARGLVTWSKALGQPAGCVRYDIGGNAVMSGVVGGASAQFTVTSASQWTAPSVATPNGEANLASSYQWNSYLKLSSASGPNGASASFTYDSMSRPASTTSPHGAVTSFAYGQTQTTATTNGKWVKTTTDGLGRTTKVESGYGTTTVSVVETEYAPCACSPLGKVKRVSMPYAPGAAVYWTEYEYDARGRTVKVTPPGNAGYTSYVYEGNTVKVIEPVVTRWKKFTLDALGRLVKVTEPRPGSPGSVDDTLYSYNALDKLTQVSMTRGSTTQIRSFVYDAEMRLSSVTQPENGTVSYTYDAQARLATKTDAKNQRVEYVYDAYNRLSMVKRYPVAGGNEDLTQRTTFEYDLGTGQNLWGRLARIVYGNGMQERYSYTGSGLVAQKTQAPAGNLSPALSLDYTWDNEGQVTSVTYPETGVPREGGGYDPLPRRVVSYTRDAAGRVQNGVSGGVTMAGNAQYNAAGQLVGYSAPGGGFGFTYNSRGQMTAQSGITYTYSATANDGRLVSRRDVASGEEVTYLYDELGRLAEAATVGPTWGLRWTFDGFGNRLSQIVTKGTGPAVNLTVNAATNRIAMSGFLYDANGNQTQWTAGLETWTANYDIENRVTQVATPWATDVYTYNAANQRVVKDNPYGSRTVDSVYGLGGELLGEYERCWTGGGWNVPCNKQERSYLGGRLIEVEGATKAVDRMGMSTALSYPYLENTGGPEATWKRGTSTGLDYAWNRYYSSTWGRFTSADPYRASGGPADPQSWNRYSYVQNDPVNYGDPMGLQRQAPWKILDILTSEGWKMFMFPNWDYDPFEGDGGGGGGGGGSSPPPECDMKNDGNARVITFLRANRDAAADLSKETGLDANFILAWAGHESGWGAGSAARKNNNFFGLTTDDWPGAIACPANAFAGFACFPVPEDGRSLLASGQSALSSADKRYLTPALAAQSKGGTAADIARAIANAGFNSEFGDDGVTYGNRIGDTFKSVTRRLKCLD